MKCLLAYHIIFYTSILTVCNVICNYNYCYADKNTDELWWVVVDTTDDFAGTTFIKEFQSIINQDSHFLYITGDECQENNIKQTITKISGLLGTEDQLILLFRGQITKPTANNQIYFVLADEQLISGQRINQWLKGIDSVVLLDCTTKSKNLEAFYANRQLLGQSAIVSIFGYSENNIVSSTNLTSQFKKILDDPSAADSDDNRQLTVYEVYETLLSQFSHSGIFVPTGDLESVLFKLPAMVKIWGEPAGVSVIMAGEEIGQTELRLTQNLDLLAHSVELHKSGYQLQQLVLPKISIQFGRQNSINYRLKPISVQGKIESSENVSPVLDEILGAGYQKTLVNTNQYLFDHWNKGYLEIGKSYIVLAKSQQQYYGLQQFVYQGNKPVVADLRLVEKTYFQAAEMLYDLSQYQDAIQAFQNGIDHNLEFPLLSDSFTKMLYDSFFNTMVQADLPVTYFAVMAELAKRVKKSAVAKNYWQKALDKSERGSETYKLAKRELRAFYAVYYYLLASVVISFLLLVFVFFGKRTRSDRNV